MKKFLVLAIILLMAGVFVAAGGTATPVYGFAQSPALTKFIQPIRGLGGATGIPVAASDGTRSWPGVTATHYTIDIAPFEDLLHPELANPTRLWGYGGPATGNGLQTPGRDHRSPEGAACPDHLPKQTAGNAYPSR